jgi:hypothetical protein
MISRKSVDVCSQYLDYLQFNPLKPTGNYVYHLLYQSVTVHFVFMDLVWFSV